MLYLKQIFFAACLLLCSCSASYHYQCKFDISENFYRQPNREEVRAKIVNVLEKFAEKENLTIKVKKNINEPFKFTDIEIYHPIKEVKISRTDEIFSLSYDSGDTCFYVYFYDYNLFDGKYDCENNYYSKLCETLRNNNIKYQENVRADFLPF